MTAGPLRGMRIVELAGIGPGPFAAMMLSDMGAEVLRIDRAQGTAEDAPLWDVHARGRRSVALDLKHPQGPEVVLRLVERADALIEGFRPGVAERLGIGPQECLARQPRLVYGRMTGWGQSGPYAQAAGRDINYVALSGTLAMIGRAGEPPVPPPALVGDYGGGGMLLAFGLLCGIIEASGSGQGQVVDAAMIDGAAALAGLLHGLRADGRWGDRGTNLFDTGSWFYEVYETADARYVSVGAIDPRSRAELLERMGAPDITDKQQMAALVRTKTRDEWCALLEGSDACFAPVLDPGEAPEHPHVRERGTFVDVGGVVQPAPAPRFSRTPAGTPTPPSPPGAHTEAALTDWGFGPEDVEALVAEGAVALRPPEDLW